MSSGRQDQKSGISWGVAPETICGEFALLLGTAIGTPVGTKVTQSASN
jgi:hypothetical protein